MKNLFRDLSVDDRLEVLNFVLIKELHSLGIHPDLRPPLVAVDDLPRYCLARLRLENGFPAQIQISRQAVLSNDWRLSLQGVLHEARHCWQVLLIRTMEQLPLEKWYAKKYRQARQFRYDLLHYNENCGLYAYQNQAIERDANWFARKRSRFYRKRFPRIINAQLNRRGLPSEGLLYG